MKRLLCVLLAITLAAGLTAGCGKGGEESSGPDEGVSSQQPEEEADPVLRVYTPLPPEIANAAAEGFSAETGEEVELVFGSASELVGRIRGESSAPQADLLFGAGAEVVQQFDELFAPYESAAAGAVLPAYASGSHLWTPLTPMPIVLMYSKEQTTRAPAGWATLAIDDYRGWIAFADPASSGTSYTALCVMKQAADWNGVTGDAFVERFAQNLDGKMLGGIQDVYKQIADGVLAAGITLEGSARKYLDAGYENKVGISYPQEGTTAALEVSAVVNGAKHEELAHQFIDYVTGSAFQQLLVEQHQRRSVRTDVDDPEGCTPRDQIPFIQYDYEAAVDGRAALLQVFGAAEQSAKDNASDTIPG